MGMLKDAGKPKRRLLKDQDIAPKDLSRVQEVEVSSEVPNCCTIQSHMNLNSYFYVTVLFQEPF